MRKALVAIVCGCVIATFFAWAKGRDRPAPEVCSSKHITEGCFIIIEEDECNDCIGI